MRDMMASEPNRGPQINAALEEDLQGHRQTQALLHGRSFGSVSPADK
jgi:hypothetical protein